LGFADEFFSEDLVDGAFFGLLVLVEEEAQVEGVTLGVEHH